MKAPIMHSISNRQPALGHARTRAALVSAVLLASGAAATALAAPQPGHFRIHSSLDPRLVAYVTRNAEAYYQNLTPRFFARGFDRPLAIYYSGTASETQKLLARFGEDTDVGYGRYFELIRTPQGAEPAVFTQRWMDDGSPAGWGSLQHEITHHFVALNFNDPPTWFDEGLACFLGERTRVVAGRATFGRPNPWREQALRNRIEGGTRVDVRQLMSLNGEAFYRSPVGYHLARALFYWLYAEGRFDAYLKAAHGQGYSLAVLTRVTGRNEEAIDRDLLAFIRRACYPAAYLYDSNGAREPAQRIALLRRALALRPDYQPAQLALAQEYYAQRDYDRCRATLGPALADSTSPEHFEAHWVAGECDYDQHRYQLALGHYRRAAAAGDFDERQCQLYYWIGNCCYFTGDQVGMRQWYHRFVAADWEPEKHAGMIAYARKNQ